MKINIFTSISFHTQLTHNLHPLICEIDSEARCISWYLASIAERTKFQFYVTFNKNKHSCTHRPLLMLLRFSKLTLHVVLLQLYGWSLYNVMPSTVQFNICWSISGEYLYGKRRVMKMQYHWNLVSDGKILDSIWVCSFRFIQF
jgi:hypothetical protein